MPPLLGNIWSRSSFLPPALERLAVTFPIMQGRMMNQTYLQSLECTMTFSATGGGLARRALLPSGCLVGTLWFTSWFRFYVPLEAQCSFGFWKSYSLLVILFMGFSITWVQCLLSARQFYSNQIEKIRDENPHIEGMTTFVKFEWSWFWRLSFPSVS